MKKIKVLLLCFMLLLCACGTSYERDETAGEYIRISYAQLKDKIEKTI